MTGEVIDALYQPLNNEVLHCLLSPAGDAVVEGVDILDLDVDGRISRVVGDFGAQPPR